MIEGTKLLVICSTRKRPKLAKKMCDSFNKTRSNNTAIIFYVWEDDPFVEEYKELLKYEEVIYGEKRYMGEILNYITTEVYPNIPYYQNINDDHLYLVKGWDKLMLKPLEENNGWGISYCRGVNEKHNPNAEIMSGKIVQAVGYYLWPEFRQFGCEPYITEIGKRFDFFFYIKGDIIAHNCANIGAIPKDENYEFIYGEDIAHGRDSFQRWKNTKKDEDFKKIEDAMNG